MSTHPLRRLWLYPPMALVAVFVGIMMWTVKRWIV